MLAAAGKGPPPYELVLAWRVQEWGAALLGNEPLPIALVEGMTVALRTYDEVQTALYELRNKTGDEIHNISERSLEWVDELAAEGLL